MLIIIMGVSGSGKTTIGQQLAEDLDWHFVDADTFHPLSNIEKMRHGIALTDTDRLPWLISLRDFLQRQLQAGHSTVLACSALKVCYRQMLNIEQHPVRWVYLKGSAELIQQRIYARKGHYMNPDLLRSQFETLEEPDEALIVDINQPLLIIIQIIKAEFGL